MGYKSIASGAKTATVRNTTGKKESNLSDEKEKEAAAKEILGKLGSVIWGFVDSEGVFIETPKPPLVQAGYIEPPFTVTLPSGEVRHIIAKPKTYAEIADAGMEMQTTGYMERIEAERDERAKGPRIPAVKSVKVKRKVRVYTASKLKSASFIREEINLWPEVEVVARWPFSHVDGDEPLWPEDCGAHASIFWVHDEEDVRKCDVVLLFGEETDVLRGGLVEAGMGLALGKTVIVVGRNTSYGTWQHHPKVYRVKDMTNARSLLTLLAFDNG